MCGNVPPQRQEQTMAHPTVLPRLGCGYCQCLAPLQNVRIRKKDLLHFKVSVARALLNAGPTKIRARERPSATPPPVKRRAVSKAPPEIRFGPGNHWPELIQAKNANRCHDAACTRKTKYMWLCAPGCFSSFHTR